MDMEGSQLMKMLIIHEWTFGKTDVYNSIHIEEYESEARDTRTWALKNTRELPNVWEDALKDL